MKIVLLAVAGLSPQVLTETLYALHQQGRPVDEIHIITTRSGKDCIHATLLAPTDGMFRRYLADYGLVPGKIAFDFDQVHVVRDENGIELDDILDEDDNALLMRLCMELAFRFTADPGSAVYFSIAGGRKTMSACLMAAAQFYARPQDRIYHVLLTPEFESNRNFYYPPPQSRPLELRDHDGKPYIRETRYAEVSLVTIPFVSLRGQLTEDMLRTPKDPATLMQALIREAPPLLEVDLPAACLRYKGCELDLHPAHLALYAFFALQKKACTRQDGCRGCTDCYLMLTEIFDRQEELTALYQRVSPTRELCAMSETGIAGLNSDNFQSLKSKLKHSIETSFGLTAARDLTIISTGRRPNTRFGLHLPREHIRVIL